MGTTTKILKAREDGMYDVMHVSMSGYPSHVGRQLLDHHATEDDVARMFEIGDGRNSRDVYSFPRRPIEPADFTRDERCLALAPFPVADIGRVMAGYTYFLFHEDAWYWMPIEAAEATTMARDAGAPLTHDEVISMAVPLVDAVDEDERPFREARERREKTFQEARGDTGVEGLAADLVEEDGRWIVVLAKNGARIAAMKPDEAMDLMRRIATLAGEGELRRREKARPED